MGKLFVSTIALLTIMLIACESTSVVEPIKTQTKSNFMYKGGLNTSFDLVLAEFQGKARVMELNQNLYRLDIQINVRGKSNNQSEQGNILFRYEFESSTGIIPEGDYKVELQEPNDYLAQGGYNLSNGNNSFSRYSFNGSKLSLKILLGKSNHIIGMFMLHLNQKSGERMFDGQLEYVELSVPVVATGYFDLDVE